MSAALLAGVDLSSKRIDCALIPLDPSDGSDAPAVTLRSFEMPTWRRETTPAFRTVERCRVVRDAMRELLREVTVISRGGDWSHSGPTDHASYEIVHVCVETPIGSKSRSTVLWELYGAILASIPSHIERDTILTNEWRRIIFADSERHLYDQFRWKAAAIELAQDMTSVRMDEHQAESYLIARACRERLEAAVKGAV